MDLKHSPENGFQQTSCAEYLRGWYAAPQGRRVLETVLREIGDHRALRYGDALLEIAPVRLVDEEKVGPAWTLRVGSEAAALRADPLRLPLPAESIACVLLAHACTDPSGAGPLIAEAARVLAPEGCLLLLESGACAASGRHARGSALPPGMRRGVYRRWLEQAGLSVRGQSVLSVLPARLPSSWHRALGRADALAAPWFPMLGSCVLTIAQRRDLMPLSTRSRWRALRVPVRASGSSQWA